MEKKLQSLVVLSLTILLSSMSCGDNSPKPESIDFQLFHNLPGSCPTYFFNSLNTQESHIPIESSKPVIESFLQAHPDASKVKISLKKTGKIIQHTCGDREAHPKLHPFVEIEVISMKEI
ncbi:hypothetical protein [Emticicia agri]|uniref:Lipoprotein n=1 Tax=Emticicia agri TaxID=2492393 RepID=A0A4Q5M574_9BACT|nr:hypothetical protein [Emticicia agri]RYU97279.1 hypothetical protein EWM59_03065 [Emticicia agri]